MIDLDYMFQDRKRGSMSNKKDQQWNQYHATRLNLIQSIESHMESIGKVNVYNNVTNTSGDHSLMDEHMGTVEMNKLKERLTK